MRKLEDNQIHQKGRQDASAWVTEMKEETLLRLCGLVYITCVGESTFNVILFTRCSLLFYVLSASWRRVAEWVWGLVA